MMKTKRQVRRRIQQAMNELRRLRYEVEGVRCVLSKNPARSRELQILVIQLTRNLKFFFPWMP